MASPLKTHLAVAACVALAASPLAAQHVPARTMEVRPFIGTFVPAGEMADEFDLATLAGMQVALEFSRRFHVVGTFAWTYAHNAFFANDATDIWQYDLGVELNRRLAYADTWEFHPFVGLGGGGRTYDYRMRGMDGFTCTTGYATLGTELQTERVGLRAEMRNYLACFESPTTGDRHNRYNLGLSLGIAYHLR